MSLANKALSGFIWTLFSEVGNKFIGLIIGIVLARLLTPADFGLVAMIFVFFEISKSLIDSGFKEALIREKKLTEFDKGTVFFINLIVSVFLYLLLWLSAPAIADFYNNEKLISLTRFMGLIILFQALVMVQTATLNHSLKFDLLMKINLSSSIVTGVIAIVLAYLDYGVWALAIRYVSGGIITTLLFFSFNPWYPKNFIIKESFKRLFGFGSKLLMVTIINRIYQNIYKLITGKFYDAATLGLYTQAKMFVRHFTSSAINSLQKVTYPILAKTNDDPVRLKNAYRKIIKASSYVIFPFVMGLGILAEPFILTLVGEKWIETVPFLEILCLSGSLYHLHTINLNVLKVVGRSDLFLKLEIIKKIIITIAIIVGLQFGIWGLMYGLVISSFISLFINMSYTNKFLDYSYLEQFKDVIPVILYAIPMALILLLIQEYLNIIYYLQLILGLILGTITYLLTTYLLKSSALIIIIDLLSSKVPILKRIKI
jgi:O-antigen/teichoic acid export membrane protein